MWSNHGLGEASKISWEDDQGKGVGISHGLLRRFLSYTTVTTDLLRWFVFSAGMERKLTVGKMPTTTKAVGMRLSKEQGNGMVKDHTNYQVGHLLKQSQRCVRAGESSVGNHSLHGSTHNPKIQQRREEKKEEPTLRIMATVMSNYRASLQDKPQL